MAPICKGLMIGAAILLVGASLVVFVCVEVATTRVREPEHYEGGVAVAKKGINILDVVALVRTKEPATLI